MDRVFMSLFGFNIYWYAVLILIAMIIGIYLVNKDKVNVVPKNKGYNLNGKVWVERYYKDEFCKPDKDILQ